VGVPHRLSPEELNVDVRAEPIRIEVDAQGAVSGLLVAPPKPRAAYVLAHGAGAGMEHAFMRATAEGLFARGVGTVRFQFPYMERGSKRPDVPAVAQAAIRAAVAHAARLLPGVPLFAGGKSFGGRMTSQAQAAAPLEGVRGLAFLGFPLHAAGQPGDARARHLEEVEVPMLFLQGTRDALADAALMRALAGRLGKRATLTFLEDADHSFHVPASSGRTDAQVLAGALDTLAQWILSH
jgi:predicted alpha/beta-hydrolase family hydrolase